MEESIPDAIKIEKFRLKYEEAERVKNNEIILNAPNKLYSDCIFKIGENLKKGIL